MIYFQYDKETLVVCCNPVNATQHAIGQFTIPRNAITDESIIKAPKEGFKVIAIDIDVSGTPRSTEYILDLIGKTVYDKSDCNKSQKMEKLGEPDFDWTLDEPKTRFDEWFTLMAGLLTFNTSMNLNFLKWILSVDIYTLP